MAALRWIWPHPPQSRYGRAPTTRWADSGAAATASARHLCDVGRALRFQRIPLGLVHEVPDVGHPLAKLPRAGRWNEESRHCDAEHHFGELRTGDDPVMDHPG